MLDASVNHTEFEFNFAIPDVIGKTLFADFTWGKVKEGRRKFMIGCISGDCNLTGAQITLFLMVTAHLTEDTRASTVFRAAIDELVATTEHEIATTFSELRSAFLVVGRELQVRYAGLVVGATVEVVLPESQTISALIDGNLVDGILWDSILLPKEWVTKHPFLCIIRLTNGLRRLPAESNEPAGVVVPRMTTDASAALRRAFATMARDLSTCWPHFIRRIALVKAKLPQGDVANGVDRDMHAAMQSASATDVERLLAKVTAAVAPHAAVAKTVLHWVMNRERWTSVSRDHGSTLRSSLVETLFAYLNDGNNRSHLELVKKVFSRLAMYVTMLQRACAGDVVAPVLSNNAGDRNARASSATDRRMVASGFDQARATTSVAAASALAAAGAVDCIGALPGGAPAAGLSRLPVAPLPVAPANGNLNDSCREDRQQADVAAAGARHSGKFPVGSSVAQYILTNFRAFIPKRGMYQVVGFVEKPNGEINVCVQVKTTLKCFWVCGFGGIITCECRKNGCEHRLSVTDAAGLSPDCACGPTGHAIDSHCDKRFTLATKFVSFDLRNLLLAAFKAGRLVINARSVTPSLPRPRGAVMRRGAAIMFQTAYLGLCPNHSNGGFKCPVCKQQPIPATEGQVYAVMFDVNAAPYNPASQSYRTRRTSIKTVAICPTAQCLMAYGSLQTADKIALYRDTRGSEHSVTNAAWQLAAWPAAPVGRTRLCRRLSSLPSVPNSTPTFLLARWHRSCLLHQMHQTRAGVMSGTRTGPHRWIMTRNALPSNARQTQRRRLQSRQQWQHRQHRQHRQWRTLNRVHQRRRRRLAPAVGG